jgi:hypothetical protein
MLTLKDLEAAFAADLLLAHRRLQALSVIARAVKDVTDLGFSVKTEAFPLADGGGILSPVFCLDAFASPVVAEVTADSEPPDPLILAAAIADFMGASGADADVIVVEDWPDDTAGVAEAGIDAALDEVQAGPDDAGSAAAAVVAPDLPPVAPEPLPDAADPALVASVAVTPSDAKPDYHARYAGLKTKADPLTDEDRATILRMHRAGESSGAIAAALGRDPRGFYHQINTVVADATPTPVPAEVAPTAAVTLAPAVPVAEVAASVPATRAPLQETPVVNMVDAPPPGGLTSAEQRLDARLEALGNKGRFADPADDLFLVEELAKGGKLAVVALELDMDARLCKMRFDALVPTKSPDEQAAVVRALRRRAVAARARAA